MGFEVFVQKGQGIRRSNIDRLTITKPGRFNLSRFASDRISRDFIYVLLMYDRETKKIAIKPTKIRTTETYKAHFDKAGCYLFTAIMFVKYVQLNVETKVPLPVLWDAQEQMFVVDLG